MKEPKNEKKKERMKKKERKKEKKERSLEESSMGVSSSSTFQLDPVIESLKGRHMKCVR